jgi:hypothetical protein
MLDVAMNAQAATVQSGTIPQPIMSRIHALYSFGGLAGAALGFVAFCVLFGEGAMVNWSAVYLRDAVAAGTWTRCGRLRGVLADDGERSRRR